MKPTLFRQSVRNCVSPGCSCSEQAVPVITKLHIKWWETWLTESLVNICNYMLHTYLLSSGVRSNRYSLDLPFDMCVSIKLIVLVFLASLYVTSRWLATVPSGYTAVPNGYSAVPNKQLTPVPSQYQMGRVFVIACQMKMNRQATAFASDFLFFLQLPPTQPITPRVLSTRLEK